MSDSAEIRDITVEAVLPHAPEVIWKTLTTAELVGQGLMPNDFEAVVGTKFNFKAKPMGDWDGVVYCEVLEIIENRRLVHSWKGSSGKNAKYGSELDTTVTWTHSYRLRREQGSRWSTRASNFQAINLLLMP
jgi:uncharacterized protein YndB with AHSA1/START domain